eukprot:10081769-Lingulodinium_polyedra.AAC.1
MSWTCAAQPRPRSGDCSGATLSFRSGRPGNDYCAGPPSASSAQRCCSAALPTGGASCPGMST